jgi:hypothetical protein
VQPDADLFRQRRQELMQALGPSAVAIFPAAPETIRSNDVEYRYRQHSDFYYLTGFTEPGVPSTGPIKKNSPVRQAP